ncbi:MAG: hypothetical protein ACXWIZ_03405 [Caldimonas sp.]
MSDRRAGAADHAIGNERRAGPWRWLVGIALALALFESRAQTIDDVSVQAQGDDLVARVAFNATVRFLEQQPAGAATLYRITFDLVAADEAIVNQSSQESKRVAATGAAPEFTVTYAPTRGRRVRELTLELRSPATVRVRQGPSSRTIDIVLVGLGRGAPPVSAPPRPAPAAAPAAASAPASDKPFAVTLQHVPVTELDKLLPVPGRYQSYEAFVTNSVIGGVTMAETNIGYFATREQAEAVRKSALDRFPEAAVLDLAERRSEMLRSASASAAAAPAAPPVAVAEPSASAAAAAAPAPAPVVAVAASPAVEARAAELMTRSREALAARRLEDAINGLNQLLLLPPNTFSQEAQELIGLARERAGDMRRARVEYELYLKLFPQGEGAQRVAQRLASLEGGAAPAPAAAGSAPAAAAAAGAPGGGRFTGNIAQYYYGGKARSQSLVNLAGGIDQSTITKTTESAIVSSVDLGARYSTPESETRAVVRGTGSLNLVSSSHSTSLLSAAYVDYKRNESGIAVRLGRQSSISGGLLGLFDGVSATYPVTHELKVDLMGGVPANSLVSAPSERLFAAMLEADGIFERWGGDLYIIDQTTQGIGNRRAVGVETRYSDDLFSMYSLLDYDALFRKVNAVSLQGSFQAPSQTTVTLLVDSRKAPSLQMTNALISSGATSLKELLQMQTLDEVRAAALATTAQAKQALISVSRPISAKWQLAMDLRYSAIGALPAVGNFEATPATGSQYGATLQLTGSNLYSARDINNFNLSVLSTPFFRGAQVAYNNLTGLRDNDLTLEPSLRFYTQHDNQGVRLNRISPGLRASYRLSRRASILGESIVEHSKTDGPSNNDTTNSIFFYVGYRYELF